jgi:hypothetical protein
MGRMIEVDGMQVRLKAPKVGDVVRVKDGEMYFRLPAGLPDGSEAVLVGQDSGRYIVRAFGQDWNIAIQCLVHEEELLLGGRWLDRWDRRVRRAQAAIDRLTVAAGRRDPRLGRKT